MTTAKDVVQKAGDIKAPVPSKKKKVNKVKTPKVKLVSYEVKAIIPVGMYANIQPGIIVQAETLEQAERAVMPHIEALFAKYREGGAMTVTTVPVKVKDMSTQQIVDKLNELKATPEQIMSEPTSTAQTVESTSVPTAIVMSEPYNRAMRAIESCLSIDALGLIETQVMNSVKLIDNEKQQLFTKVLLKRKELNG